MDLRKIAFIFGVIFIAVGILGFVPGITNNQMLVGIFHVNAAHNFVHLVTGIVAIICSKASEPASQAFFKIFGIVYGLVALLGFFVRDGLIFGLISNNMADVWLHVAIAVVSLILGFKKPLVTIAAA